MKANIVNETTAQVQAYNTANAAAIEAGLFPAKEQSEQARVKELRQLAKDKAEAEENERWNNNVEPVNEINRSCARAAGLSASFLSIGASYASTGSAYRSGPCNGIVLKIGSFDAQVRCYKFGKDGKLNLKRIQAILAEHYEIRKARKLHEDKMAKAKAAAAEILPADFLHRLAGITKRERLEARTTDRGLIEITYDHYNPSAHPSDWYSRRSFGMDRSVQMWLGYLDLLIKHNSEMTTHNELVRAFFNATTPEA